MNRIPFLKEQNYYVEDIPLDGDAPKQYVRAYYYYKNCPRKNEINNWHGYFAKFGRKSYPHESIIEFIINKVGESLGLLINQTQLVRISGQVRFLSQDFLKKNQKLIHGIEVIGEYLEDVDFAKEIDADRKERRKLFTFEFIEKAIQHVYPKNTDEIMTSLVELIVFDAIVGNNDRHYYNWGLIGNIRKDKSQSPKFAPIYDTARGLLWNKTEESLVRMFRQYKNGANELDHFILKSKPRISYEKNSNANHFDLVQFLSKYKQSYREVILSLINEDNRLRVKEVLNELCSEYFTKTRKELILALVDKRISYLIRVVK